MNDFITREQDYALYLEERPPMPTESSVPPVATTPTSATPSVKHVTPIFPYQPLSCPPRLERK